MVPPGQLKINRVSIVLVSKGNMKTNIQSSKAPEDESGRILRLVSKASLDGPVAA